MVSLMACAEVVLKGIHLGLQEAQVESPIRIQGKEGNQAMGLPRHLYRQVVEDEALQGRLMEAEDPRMEVLVEMDRHQLGVDPWTRMIVAIGPLMDIQLRLPFHLILILYVFPLQALLLATKYPLQYHHSVNKYLALGDHSTHQSIL